MADRKTRGGTRPPVLDLSARNVAPGQSSASPDARSAAELAGQDIAAPLDTPPLNRDALDSSISVEAIPSTAGANEAGAASDSIPQDTTGPATSLGETTFSALPLDSTVTPPTDKVEERQQDEPERITATAPDSPFVHSAGAQRDETIHTEAAALPQDPIRPAPAPVPSQPRRSGTFPVLGAMLGGGLLGLGLSAGLASLGYFPGSAEAPSDPRVAQLTDRIAALEQAGPTQDELSTRIAALEEQTSGALAALETAQLNAGPSPAPDLSSLEGNVVALSERLGALEAARSAPTDADASAPVDLSGIESEVARLNERLGAVETSLATPAPQPPVIDLAPLQAEIAALGERLDTLPPTPAVADVEALRTEIADLRQDLEGLQGELAPIGTLQEQVAGLGQRLDTADASLSGLRTDIDATIAELMAEPEPEPVDPLLQASLLASNLQNAFATGRPFQTELTGLQAALPDLAVPQEVATRAAEGLPTPSDLVARLEELAPGMLAARPPRPDASLQEGAADWLASVLAIRPTEEADGDDPAAILSRLEGALEREDYAMAEGLIAQLPAPMIEAAQDLPADITTRARANDFTQALAARVQTSGEPA